MNRTPSSARLIARSVLIAVWPMYWPTSEARSTSTRWPFSSSPIAPYISASSRATVVLPVPGLPLNTRCWLVATSGRSCSFRRACTWRKARSPCTCSFTLSSPTSPSSSACSTGSGRGGAVREPPKPSRSSSSGPAVRFSCSPMRPAASRMLSSGFGGMLGRLPRLALFERPLQLGDLPLQAGDALLERLRSFGETLCDCHTFDACRMGRLAVVRAEQLTPEVLALARPAREPLDELRVRERRKRVLDVFGRAVRVEPLDALLELARRLWPAEHQHREQSDLGRDAAERLVEQVPVLGGAAARATREPYPAPAREPVERGPDLRLTVVDDRVPVRRLVAGEPEPVQRERVLVRRRALLLDEGAEHADLDGVCVHAANGSAAARSDERAARRPVRPGAAAAPVLDRPAGGTDPAEPAEREEHDHVEGEDDDQVSHGASLSQLSHMRLPLERRWDGMVRPNEIGRVDERLDPAQAAGARAREGLARLPPRAGHVEVRVVGLPGLEDAAQLSDRLLDGRFGLGERGHPDHGQQVRCLPGIDRPVAGVAPTDRTAEGAGLRGEDRRAQDLLDEEVDQVVVDVVQHAAVAHAGSGSLGIHVQLGQLPDRDRHDG